MTVTNYELCIKELLLNDIWNYNVHSLGTFDVN